MHQTSSFLIKIFYTFYRSCTVLGRDNVPADSEEILNAIRLHLVSYCILPLTINKCCGFKMCPQLRATEKRNLTVQTPPELAKSNCNCMHLPKSRPAMRPKATSASFCIIICSLVAMVTKCLTPPPWMTVLTTSCKPQIHALKQSNPGMYRQTTTY